MSLWSPSEARLVQFRTQVSAADAHEVNVGYPGVPEGKFWTIIGFGYKPSLAETELVNIQKYTPQGGYMSLLNPITVQQDGNLFLTFIEQGMEYVLLPGEYIRVYRLDHAAGSTMTGTMQFIESDIPLYEYIEPQEFKRMNIAKSTVLRTMGVGGSPSGRPPGRTPPGAGPGGRTRL